MDLLGLVLVAGVIYLIFRFTRSGGLPRLRSGGGGKRFKCHDCQHQRKLFDDGVMCGYMDREVFKNSRHIAMCGDWHPRAR